MAKQGRSRWTVVLVHRRHLSCVCDACWCWCWRNCDGTCLTDHRFYFVRAGRVLVPVLLLRGNIFPRFILRNSKRFLSVLTPPLLTLCRAYAKDVVELSKENVPQETQAIQRPKKKSKLGTPKNSNNKFDQTVV